MLNAIRLYQSPTLNYFSNKRQQKPKALETEGLIVRKDEYSLNKDQSKVGMAWESLKEDPKELDIAVRNKAFEEEQLGLNEAENFTDFDCDPSDELLVKIDNTTKDDLLRNVWLSGASNLDLISILKNDKNHVSSQSSEPSGSLIVYGSDSLLGQDPLSGLRSPVQDDSDSCNVM